MTGEERAIQLPVQQRRAHADQASRDFGLPITTLATLPGPLIEAGEIARRPHPTDRRARLLELTEAGRRKLEAAIPDFTVAHQALLGQAWDQEVDDEAVFAALDALRLSIIRTGDLLEAEQR